VPFDAQDRHEPAPPVVPEARSCEALRGALERVLGSSHVSSDEAVRLRHGHGHHLEEIYLVLFQRLERVPHLVIFPQSDSEVQAALGVAAAHGALVIPYGGGTCVSMALACTDDRPIVSLVLCRMSG